MAQQRATLVDLYEAINGAAWSDATGSWLVHHTELHTPEFTRHHNTLYIIWRSSAFQTT